MAKKMNEIELKTAPIGIFIKSTKFNKGSNLIRPLFCGSNRVGNILTLVSCNCCREFLNSFELKFFNILLLRSFFVFSRLCLDN